MQESPRLLSSEDIQDFIHPQELYPPNGEADLFAIMAGSIVANFKMLNELHPEDQELIFTHLHTYAFLLFSQYDHSWNRISSSSNGKTKARNTINEMIESDSGFDAVNDVVQTLYTEKTSESRVLKQQISNAQNTLFDMFQNKAHTYEDLLAHNIKKSSLRKTQSAQSQNVKGRSFHTNSIHTGRKPEQY